MSLFANVPCRIRGIPEHLKMQEMCDEAAEMEPYSLAYVPDRFKIEGMCKEAELIIAMMISLLSGTKAVKSVRLEKRKLKKS